MRYSIAFYLHRQIQIKRFQQYAPCDALNPYIKQFYISENPVAETYKVLPVPGVVIGFQYAGALTLVDGSGKSQLSEAGITGFADRFRTYHNTAGIGTVLVYFTETGLSHFTDCPANHLFSESVSLDHLFKRAKVDEVTSRLSDASSDVERISIVERFLLSEIKHTATNQMLRAAVDSIYQSNGALKIGDLGRQLYTSTSVLERRFKTDIGVTPKKFASIVRFNSILNDLRAGTSLLDICYHNNYFDQAHFIRDFKNFTGETPHDFRRLQAVI